MFVAWGDIGRRGSGEVLVGVVLFYADVAYVVAVFTGHLFDEFSPKGEAYGASVVRYGASIQHWDDKAVFHRQFTYGIRFES